MSKNWKKAARFCVTALLGASLCVGTTACNFKSCGGDGGGKGEAYTYRTATNSLPTSWNVHTYQANSATDILDYTEDTLYTFDYNESKDGYRIVPSMASAMPEDVTSVYVGAAWGISSGDKWKAVRVALRHDLKFDNGDPITAQDFVESIELLLNPEAANFRADSLYGGQFSLVNAESYVKQGTYAYSPMVSADYGAEEYFDPDDLVADKDGYLQSDGRDAVVNIYDGGNWGSNGLAAYHDAGRFSVAGWDEFAASADDDGYIRLNAQGLEIVRNAIAQLHGYAGADEYIADSIARGDFVGENGDIPYGAAEWEEMCFFGREWENGIPFSEVGVKAVDDFTLDFILDKPLSGFYLNYALASSMFLVHTKTYKACTGTSAGAYTNSYGTSVNTYVGFGPYKLSSYVADSVASFVKNPYWWGYTSGELADEYQTTNISIQQVTEATTRLNMFLSGELDSYGLQAADMATYSSSDFLYRTEGDSTWFIALNPDFNGLSAAQAAATPSTSGKVVNKTVLTLKSFRQALSFSVDRAAYGLALDPVGGVAKALFGNMIISDPEAGTAYRTTDEAKSVIVDFWGLGDEIGEGKEYATVDEAISSITGYDPTGAQALFGKAYDEAVGAGYINPASDWEVQIVIGQPGNGGVAYYNDGYEFLSKAWTEAVKGTPFEGRLVFSQSQPLGSTNFSSFLKDNSVDVLFGVGWTGSALDPYSLMEAYVSPNYQYDPGWDTAATPLDVTVGEDGKTLRASVYEWGYLALQGNDITAQVVVDGNETGETVTVNAGTAAEPALRLKILAAVEGAVLNEYDMLPVGTSATANLKGARIEYYTEEYVYGVGRGGVRYMTYKMNDAEWASYVASQGGKLNYQ